MTTEAGRINIEDPAALLRYLREQALIGTGESPTLQTLAGGVSNRTVLVRRQSGEDWVLKQALAKLRVEVDWFSAPERIQREAAGLRWLGEIIPGHVPQFVFADEKQHILGMSAIPQPHQNWKVALLDGKTMYRAGAGLRSLVGDDSQRSRPIPRALRCIRRSALL